MLEENFANPDIFIRLTSLYFRISDIFFQSIRLESNTSDRLKTFSDAGISVSLNYNLKGSLKRFLR